VRVDECSDHVGGTVLGQTRPQGALLRERSGQAPLVFVACPLLAGVQVGDLRVGGGRAATTSDSAATCSPIRVAMEASRSVWRRGSGSRSIACQS
jgi:hypothetical protein